MAFLSHPPPSLSRSRSRALALSLQLYEHMYNVMICMLNCYLFIVNWASKVVFCVVFCRSLFVLFVIVLSILRFTAANYPLVSFKLSFFDSFFPIHFTFISIKYVLNANGIFQIVDWLFLFNVA